MPFPSAAAALVGAWGAMAVVIAIAAGGSLSISSGPTGAVALRDPPSELARRVKPALDLIGKKSAGAAPTTASSAPPAGLDAAKLAKIVGHEGEQTGAVYKITIGRDDLHVAEMGAPINARMGLNTWAAFVGTNDNAAIAGDVAMLANEVTPVLKALRKNGLTVVAIHHHMTDTQPTIYFLHYWGTGPAEKLASAFKAALAETGGRN